LEIRAKPGKKKADLVGDGDGMDGRGVTGGDEEKKP
jgi:hypothetical protein